MSLTFTVSTADTAPLLALRNAAKRQRYAIANAITATLLRIQASVPDHLRRQGFVVRKRDFFFGRGGQRGGAANKINRGDFPDPKAGRLRGRVWIEASTLSSTRRLILPQFEAGGVRRPFTSGARRVAVPILGRPARPSVATGVPPEYAFANLRLRGYRNGKKVRTRARGRHVREVTQFGQYGAFNPADTSGGALQWKGLHRTFQISPLRDGRPGGVFQRVGRGRGGIRPLYAFIPPPHLDARLRYGANAQAVTDRVFRPALLAEVRKTLDFHARKEAAA